MPYKPKKPCRYPGCPELTHRRYCAAHTKVENKRYEKYDRNPDTHKRYDGRWKKIRATYMAAHPLCEECKQHGRLTPAQEVHHKIPLANGGTHDTSNLRALCKSCHSRETARETWG